LLVAALTVPAIAMLHSTVDFSIQMPAIAFLSAAFPGHGLGPDIHRDLQARQMLPGRGIN
jgi:hypothetical protein